MYRSVLTLDFDDQKKEASLTVLRGGVGGAGTRTSRLPRLLPLRSHSSTGPRNLGPGLVAAAVIKRRKRRCQKL